MKIAIEGCLHGQLQEVYQQLNQLQSKLEIKLDFLLICGDFQSLRHEQDMQDMHCPQKYKTMGCFREYYERKKVAPILTIFIGGNHEAVNSLRQSHFGGWVAPNIYFLGQAGSIFVRKGSQVLRITGCSGIYNSSDFKYCTRVERYPLRGKDRITAYHTKQVDLYRLELLSRISQMQRQQPNIYGKAYTNFDIFLSHDWPKDIALYGSMQQLLTYKPFLKKQIESRSFGSAPLLRILDVAKPNYWFSAHMHVKYAALFPHPQNIFTHFLSLDKCLGKRSCLQIIQINHADDKDNCEQMGEIKIEVDPTWMGVLVLTQQLMEGNDQLYYNDKQNVRLVDNERMNSLIKKYLQIKQQIEGKKYSFDDRLSQVEQTQSFIKLVGLQRRIFEGICLQRGEYSVGIQKGEQKVEIENGDQIQLDL